MFTIRADIKIAMHIYAKTFSAFVLNVKYNIKTQ